MNHDACQDPTDDDALVVRAKTDREAFGQLFDRYYPRVLGYCLRRLGDRAAAEDATSDAFLNVASHLRNFAGTSETDFRRWLFRIATNAAHALARQGGRRQALLQSAVDEGRLPRNRGDDLAVTDDQTDWPHVQRAILELDEREQTIVSLRFFAGLSHDEIAAVIEATPGAVRTALSRAIALLRGKLGAGSPAPRDP